jgi:hypothetical protein
MVHHGLVLLLLPLGLVWVLRVGRWKEDALGPP